MAKKDMSFMKMVSNDEDFHREVYDHGQENLLVMVDIYTKVWGPCLMLDNYLYNSFFDMSDAGMGVKFVRAQCDKILELSEYRDTACPHFLFYMNGEKIEHVEGPKIPELSKHMNSHAVKVA